MSRQRTMTTICFSVAMFAIGVVMIVRTLDAGGHALSTGLLLGALFILAGAGRVYVAYRMR
jgi:hypothetical protein